MASILDKEYHAKLIANLAKISYESNVPVTFITQSAKDYCTQVQLDWLKDYKNKTNLCLVGDSTSTPETQCAALAAALIRNYIDAKMVTLQSILKDEVLDANVLFVPNFYRTSDSKALAEWQCSLLYDFLSCRFMAGKRTVLHIDNLDAMAKAYGKSFTRHIKEVYEVIEG